MEKEAGHSQLKIVPRLKFQDMMERGEEDRISLLSDCLLIEILSRLPSTKEAIRTGTLSKRWKHLWISVPNLIFEFYDHNLHWSDIILVVDKTLTQCRQQKLKRFKVYTDYDIGFELQVNNWICYAITRNVEELNITLWNIADEFPLDQSFFINTSFTDLTLEGCIFNPIGAISWKNLRSLCITYGNLGEDLIENILSGNPVLETLVLKGCSGYKRLDIASKSIKNLVLDDCYCNRPLDIVEIQAPNILSLTIKGRLWLMKLLLLNVSSVTEANLDYRIAGHRETIRKQEEEGMLKGFILNLCHIKELKIGGSCSEVSSRLEAKGFFIPSNVKFT